MDMLKRVQIILMIFTISLSVWQPMGSSQEELGAVGTVLHESNDQDQTPDEGSGARGRGAVPVVKIPVTSGPTFFPFSFKASDSYGSEPDGEIVRWLWDFGDGTNSSDADTTHSYKKEGFYKISLTVWNITGVSRTNSNFSVVVYDRCPCVQLHLKKEGKVNTPIKMSFNPVDENCIIESYFWDFGDGKTLPESGEGWTNISKPYHEWVLPGGVKSRVYTVTVKVRDIYGKTNVTSSTIRITWGDFQGPEIKFDRVRVGSNLFYSFRLELNDFKGNITGYRWDFGDGYASTRILPMHCYEQEGTYNVTLRYNDDQGYVGAIREQVEIKYEPKGLDNNFQKAFRNVILSITLAIFLLLTLILIDNSLVKTSDEK